MGGATCGWSKQLPLWCDWMEASPSLPSYFSLSAPTTRSSTPNIYPPWFKISPVTSHSIRRLTQLKTKPHQKQVTGVLSNIPEGTGVRVLEGSASGPGRKPRGEGGGAVDSCGLVGGWGCRAETPVLGAPLLNGACRTACTCARGPQHGHAPWDTAHLGPAPASLLAPLSLMDSHRPTLRCPLKWLFNGRAPGPPGCSLGLQASQPAQRPHSQLSHRQGPPQTSAL